MVGHRPRGRLLPHRRLLAVTAILSLMIAGITVTTTDKPVPGIPALPGATAEPTMPTGPGSGNGGHGGGSQFQPPGMGGIDGSYGGGNYPAPPQGNGIDINNPSAAPDYSQAPQQRVPVHGTQPPNYDLPPQQQQPAQQAPVQQPEPAQQEPAQQEPVEQVDPPQNAEDQVLRDLQRQCEDVAQLLGITEQVMVLPENLPAGDARNGPGRTVGGGIGACGICPPQQGPQTTDLPQRPIPRPTTIRPRPIENPNFDEPTEATDQSPYPDDYCTPEHNGGTNACRGPVGVCFPQTVNDPTPAMRQELDDYVWYSNDLRAANGGTLTRRSTQGMESRRQKETKNARKNNPAYNDKSKVAGHMPDLLWGAQEEIDESRKIMPMDKSLNASIGWQGSRFPLGYQATGFYEGIWTYGASGAGNCMAVLG